MRPEGIFKLLASVSVSTAAVSLVFVTVGVIWILRDKFQGFGYNVALSSQVGDLALVGCILIGIEVLQSGGQPPGWLIAREVQVTILLLCFAVGFVWMIIDQPPRWGDRYHHMVVAPLLTLLIVNTVPLVFVGGTYHQMMVVTVFLGLWAVLVVIDVVTGRMNQEQRLKEQGVILKD